MNFRKSKLLLIPLALFTAMSLTGCGSQKQVAKQPHIKTAQMSYRNINGGNQNLSNFTAVHSAHGLNKALHTDRIKEIKIRKKYHAKGKSKYRIIKQIKPKAILINSSLNGSSNDTLQNKEQNEENRLENRINTLKQKPQPKDNSISGMSKQEKQAQNKSIQKEWQNNKKQAQQIQKELKQKKHTYQQLDKQRTQAVTVNVPSNTTIVGSPNIQMQNLTFNLKGHNIILKNLDMQAPNNYANNTNNGTKNDSVYMNHVNGVKLQYDTFTDSTTNANQSVRDNRRQNTNRKQSAKGKKKNDEDQQADSLTDIMGQSKHIEITQTRYTNAHKAIFIGSSNNDRSDSPQVRINSNFFEDVAQDAPHVANGHITLNHNYYSEDNKKPYQFKYGFFVSPNSSISAHRDTFNIDGVASRNVAKHLIQTQNGKSNKEMKNTDINVNNQNYHYMNQDHSLQVKVSQSLAQPLAVSDFYSDGSILGESNALS